MKRRILIGLCILALAQMSYSQSDHWGAGNDENIIVTSSSNYAPINWSYSADAANTINGKGLDARILETSRFMAQATLGVPPEEIDRAAAMSFEEWIDEQVETQPMSMLDEMEDLWDEVVDWHFSQGGDSTNLYGPDWTEFNYTWWTANMIREDYLRHRVALALSEIFVISINTDLSSFGWGLASYYDALFLNALGNYRDVLEDVTLHPCMGFYLSHLNNPRSNPAENIHPDENYAREVMQLFSIGLYELNNDGSRKLDGGGQPIPTYGQEEITEFAKIFTGLGISEVVDNQWVDSAYFDLSIYVADMTKPMKMYEDWHEPGEKELLNGMLVPDGQPGMQDVQMALDNLFNHPNVGPFIGRQLIQRLIKSNPTPQYIDRVAQVFNNNGQGVRGDLAAVVKAILLDPEARECRNLMEEESARLREPLVRYTHFARSVEREHIYGRHWNVGYGFWDATGQTPMGAPSVFNFFLPDFQPNGDLADRGLVAPEYQIHNTKLSVGFINEVNGWIVWNGLFGDWESNHPDVGIDVDRYKEFANDPETLLNELDKVYTHGQLTDRTREIIKAAISPLIYRYYREDRVRLAMYLLMISPDYAVTR